MASSLSIKGTREGLTITLGDGDLGGMLGDLEQHLAMQRGFFRGGSVALRAGNRVLGTRDLVSVREMLGGHEMVLRTVVTGNENTGRAARDLGLRVMDDVALGEEPTPAAPRAPRSRGGPLEGERAVLVEHIIRSGQIVRHTGTVVVVGDINPGAQVIAGGSILVWGGIYGLAHAGALGDEAAIICALDMSPIQLRIGEKAARSDSDRRKPPGKPEVARVRDGQIVVEAWTNARRG